MKIAFSTLGCPGWSWNEIFATAKDLNFNGIEIRGIGSEMYAPNIKEFSDECIKSTLERLKIAGIEIPMLTSGAVLGIHGDRSKDLKEAKEYIDMASKLGVPYVRVMITPVPQPTDDFDMDQTQKLYHELCNFAQGKNVTVLIETNGPLADSKILKTFMQHTDPETAGVLWDIHHPYRYFGETPEYTFENLKPYIKYLHVKDSVMVSENATYRMMGYGDVPIFDALKTMSNAGYKGYVSLEWVKRWCPDLQEPGIVFSHYTNYINYLLKQIL